MVVPPNAYNACRRFVELVRATVAVSVTTWPAVELLGDAPRVVVVPAWPTAWTVVPLEMAKVASPRLAAVDGGEPTARVAIEVAGAAGAQARSGTVVLGSLNVAVPVGVPVDPDVGCHGG